MSRYRLLDPTFEAVPVPAYTDDAERAAVSAWIKRRSGDQQVWSMRYGLTIHGSDAADLHVAPGHWLCWSDERGFWAVSPTEFARRYELAQPPDLSPD